jgi:hypothetical protein
MQKGNITFESLEPFPQSYDFIQLTQKLKEILGKVSKKKKNSTNKNKAPVKPEPQNKPIDWTMQLAVINYLRRLLKYEKEIETLKNDLTHKFILESSMQKGNISYENLEPFPKDYDFIQLIQNLRKY